MTGRLRIALCLWAAAGAVAAPPCAREAGAREPQPVFAADLPNPNDFSLFANGGWDGNWYVGYDTCWMQKLAVPEGSYRKVFVGARLGRMKSFQPEGRAPWEKKAFPGHVYASISATAAWTRAQSYFLTATDDIPLEPDFENAVEGTGESRWFWTEVPLKSAPPGRDVYVAVWSPSKNLASVSSAPILAAGWGDKEVNSWVAHDAKGAPPLDPAKALATPVTVFEPAIALKLVPAGAPEEKPRVRITRVGDGKARGKMPAPKVVWSDVDGPVERAWVEVSTDSAVWSRAGWTQWNPPYSFTLRMHEVPVGKEGKTWVRVQAVDVYGNAGWSEPVNIFETLR